MNRLKPLVIALSCLIAFMLNARAAIADGETLVLPKTMAVPEFVCAQVLGASTAATFLDSLCEEITLSEPTSFYRYYSDEDYAKGRYLTESLFYTPEDTIKNLALKAEWGNQATQISIVRLPAGAKIYKGIVGSQDPADLYPGGGSQVFIQDSRDPNIEWFPGMPIENAKIWQDLFATQLTCDDTAIALD